MSNRNGAVRPHTDNRKPLSRYAKKRLRRKAEALPSTDGPSSGPFTVCTIGGVADIGMNWTLYGCGDSFILVDAGTSFAPREMAGVSAILPDPRLLESLGANLLGLVLTHWHLDHCGAIHHVWPAFATCPIHAPRFAAGMLANKLQDAGVKGGIELRPFEPGRPFRIGPFRIEPLPVAHSTPDCVALSIEAAGRRVLHTGDWKLDDAPGVGHRTDLTRFRALGDRRVDLMLCDSTNADHESPGSSEASVERALTRVFRACRGMVFVSSFGSNVARMASVAHAARKASRKVALAGRALRESAEVASGMGMFSGLPRFLEDPRDFRGAERRGRVLMCTGTQGEDNAALAKIARGRDDRLPDVQPGDVVVHSARIIPGNECYVADVLSRLSAMGARIVTAVDLVEGDPVHVTGHPVRADLRAMYAAVRPRAAMPIHGGPAHLGAHAELLGSIGIPSVVPVIGGIYEVLDGGVRMVGRRDVPLVAVVGDVSTFLAPWDAEALRPDLEAPAIEPASRRDRPAGASSKAPSHKAPSPKSLSVKSVSSPKSVSGDLGGRDRPVRQGPRAAPCSLRKSSSSERNPASVPAPVRNASARPSVALNRDFIERLQAAT